MSFKREGNSDEWLHQIKKRRVQELFAEDIPEGEAKLMKNGRFYCTVCPNYPTFDTVVMLSHHRHGKKHTANEQYRNNEQLELEQLLQKRQHHEYETTGKITSSLQDVPVLGPGSSSFLAHTTAYSSSHKTTSNTGKRKVVLQFQKGVKMCDSTNSGNNKAPETIAEYVKMRNFNDFSKTSSPVIPYQKKTLQREQQTVNFNNEKVLHKQSMHSHQKEAPVIHSKSEEVVPHCSSTAVKHTKPTSKKKHAAKKSLSSEEQTKVLKVEKYLQARGSGWKKDLSGNWMKDEDAEFDSDEEAPDLP